jgi:hypothetical protein
LTLSGHQHEGLASGLGRSGIDPHQFIPLIFALNWPNRLTDAKELSMLSRRVGAAPAEFPQQRDALADNGDHGPMSQQDAVGSHGHEIYPQEFVRLVGCHGLGKHEVAHRLH